MTQTAAAQEFIGLSRARSSLGNQHHALSLENTTQRRTFAVQHGLSQREMESILAGGLTAWIKERAGVSP